MFLKKSISIVLILLLSVTFQSFDCESEDFVDSCSAQIKGYKFLKANRINIGGGGRSRGGTSSEGGEVLVKQVFSKGTTYKITACSGIDQSLEVELKDRTGRKSLMSNYSKKSKKHYPSITYPCKATGVYYLSYSFADDAEAGCGLSVIGFRK